MFTGGTIWVLTHGHVMEPFFFTSPGSGLSPGQGTGWLVGWLVGWVGLGWVGLGWVGLGWVGLVGWLVGWLVGRPHPQHPQHHRPRSDWGGQLASMRRQFRVASRWFRGILGLAEVLYNQGGSWVCSGFIEAL